MIGIEIEIIRFISEAQPGFVECRFTDARNQVHLIEEKVPVISSIPYTKNSSYPQKEVIACEILGRWLDEEGRKLVKITIAKPWGIETILGQTDFDVLEESLIKI